MRSPDPHPARSCVVCWWSASESGCEWTDSRTRSTTEGSPPPQGVEERAELSVGLVDLVRRVTGLDDASPGVEGCPISVQRGAAKSDGPLPVPVRVHPSDGTGVQASVEVLELADRCPRDGRRLAADGGRRVERGDQLERCRGRIAKNSEEPRREVPDVCGLEKDRFA